MSFPFLPRPLPPLAIHSPKPVVYPKAASRDSDNRSVVVMSSGRGLTWKRRWIVIRPNDFEFDSPLHSPMVYMKSWYRVLELRLPSLQHLVQWSIDNRVRLLHVRRVDQVEEVGGDGIGYLRIDGTSMRLMIRQKSRQ